MLAVSLSPAFLIASSVVVIATLLWGGRPAAPDAESYSGVDRALHRVAFATYEVQADLADIEDRLFASHLGSITNQRPVFITSLPRAGTTLLLECCAALDEFASHTYRDMPFVMIPCLWSSFSGAFRREGRLKPRAHGDGMQIDFDSPEALEEVLWLKFWAKQYQADRILPWPARPRVEFTTFFARHMRKIAWVRRGVRAEGVRYISKNNLNIARIPLVRQMFPDATIVVPVRAPLDHCSSLLQQHRQFSELHAHDAFASRYMRAIGHFDFGEHLRPVDFDRWYNGRAQKDALAMSFWLEVLGGGLSAPAGVGRRAGALPRLRPVVRQSRRRTPAAGGADRLPGCRPPAGVGGGNSAARARARSTRPECRPSYSGKRRTRTTPYAPPLAPETPFAVVPTAVAADGAALSFWRRAFRPAPTGVRRGRRAGPRPLPSTARASSRCWTASGSTSTRSVGGAARLARPSIGLRMEWA